MVSLSMAPDFRGQWSEVGRLFAAGVGWLLFAAGWLMAKAFRALGVAVGAVFYAVGWVGGTVVWPVLAFTGRAAAAGWTEGRRPRGQVA